MDYQKLHNLIIADARTNLPTGYTESHHIIPRCMGGGNEPENRVRLSGRQHFIIHKLLTKIYPNEPKLWYAFNMMFSKTKPRKLDLGWIKSVSRNYEYRRKTYKNPMVGKTHSIETKLLISKTHKGKKQSPEHIKLRTTNKQAMSKESQQRQADKLSKYYEVTTPSGQIIKIKGLRKFCKENGLNQGAMSIVLNPKYPNRNHHKGFKIRYLDL